MTNNEIRHTIAEMMHDWNALTHEQQKRASLIANIAAAEVELSHRERADAHLTGIVKLQNATAVEKLCDALIALNIELLESRGR